MLATQIGNLFVQGFKQAYFRDSLFFTIFE